VNRWVGPTKHLREPCPCGSGATHGACCGSRYQARREKRRLYYLRRTGKLAALVTEADHAEAGVERVLPPKTEGTFRPGIE